jgi:hypothetical protein
MGVAIMDSAPIDSKHSRPPFTPEQLAVVNQAVGIAEELVSNHYKMSASQWLRPKYDVKTLVELDPPEIVDGPFAQIIRYQGQPKAASLTSATYDFYKICLQDHAILSALRQKPDLQLLPFALYIITHELIHIVRFSKFLQGFDASADERLAEEQRVHERTHDILLGVKLAGLPDVLHFYRDWRRVYEQIDYHP